MKTILFTCFVLAFSSALTAQNVNIPDANFKAAMVNNSFVNTNGDSEIQLSEAQACTILNCINQNINDLTGLEEFVNLEYLFMSDNNISTADLSPLTQLIWLNIKNNALTSITLPTTMNDLERLHLSYNQLPMVDLSNITSKAEYIDLRHNQLTSLASFTTQGTGTLLCGNNQLDSLTIPDNTRAVHCDSNQLVHIDFPTMGLDTLKASHNLLDTIGVPSGLGLVYADVSYNNMMELYIAVPSLRYFDISHNQLVRLTVDNNSDDNSFPLDASNNPNLLCIQTNQRPGNGLVNWTFDSQTTVSADCSGIWNSITQLSTLEGVELYPNPTSHQVQVDLGEVHEQIGITIYNNLGQQVDYIEHYYQQQVQIALPNTKGLYWLQLQTEQGQITLPVQKK